MLYFDMQHILINPFFQFNLHRCFCVFVFALPLLFFQNKRVQLCHMFTLYQSNTILICSTVKHALSNQVNSCLTCITCGALPSSLTSTNTLSGYYVTLFGDCTIITAIVLTVWSVQSHLTFCNMQTFLQVQAWILRKIIINKMGPIKTYYSIKNIFRLIVLLLVHVKFCSIKGDRGNLRTEL